MTGDMGKRPLRHSEGQGQGPCSSPSRDRDRACGTPYSSPSFSPCPTQTVSTIYLYYVARIVQRKDENPRGITSSKMILVLACPPRTSWSSYRYPCNRTPPRPLLGSVLEKCGVAEGWGSSIFFFCFAASCESFLLSDID